MPTREQQEAVKVGAKVRIVSACVDFHFFRSDETGVVVRNSGGYMGIIVKFDTPHMVEYAGGKTWLMEEFNFNAGDLAIIEEPVHGSGGEVSPKEGGE